MMNEHIFLKQKYPEWCIFQTVTADTFVYAVHRMGITLKGRYTKWVQYSVELQEKLTSVTNLSALAGLHPSSYKLYLKQTVFWFSAVFYEELLLTVNQSIPLLKFLY